MFFFLEANVMLALKSVTFPIFAYVKFLRLESSVSSFSSSFVPIINLEMEIAKKYLQIYLRISIMILIDCLIDS